MLLFKSRIFAIFVAIQLRLLHFLAAKKFTDLATETVLMDEEENIIHYSSFFLINSNLATL